MVADTIIAVSSPAGNSLRGIVRLSGPEAFRLVNAAVGHLLSYKQSWEVIYCSLRIQFVNRQTIAIPVTLYLMPTPHSYTREDVVEIHTFGSKVLLESILQYFIRKGARLAQPGEFTKRAFLNGRISLSQSEAVMNIIHSSTEREHHLAVNQLHQHSFQQLREINQQLLNLVSRMELALDFSDQDIEIISPEQITDWLNRIITGISKTLKESSGYSATTDGITCVLCGRPNTGKSSLFNCLVTSRKNIVSAIPGTTRDYIEGKFSHKNTAFRLFDTAGINSPATKTPLPVRQADIYLMIIDGSQGLVKQDNAILKRLKPAKTILVINKTDLSLLSDNGQTGKLANWKTPIKTSALTGSGIPALKNALIKLAHATPPERSSDRTLINLRQQENLRASLELLNKALSGAKRGTSYEFIGLDLKDTLEQLNLALGSFSTGGADPELPASREGLGYGAHKNIATDDILNNIFSRFCIGK
jgi:tRNA modification GTPase